MTREPVRIIIAFKGRAGAKSRLASVLGDAKREALAFSMAERVLGVCASVSQHVYVVTACAAARELAARHGANVIDDRREAGTAAAYEQALTQLDGAAPKLFINADLPLLQRADVEEMIRVPGAGAIAPDRRGIGTNALYLPGGVELRPQFGADSFARHVQDAERRGLRVRVVRKRGLIVDIDEPSDLELLTSHASGAP